MPNLVKTRMLEELGRELRDASTVLFVGTQGLNVAEADRLRAALGESKVGMRVVKNTLASRLFAERGLAAEGFLRGPTAVLPTTEDGAVAAARVLVEAKKRLPFLELRGGVLEGRALDGEGVQALASIPSRPVLLAQTLATIAAPASEVASLFAAALSLPARLALARAREMETESADAPPA